MKLCVFDLDGTLFNTMPDLLPAFNTAITKYGFNPCSAQRFGTMIGAGFQEAILHMLPEDFDNEEQFADMCQTFKQIYLQSYANNTFPYDGIEETLAKLLVKGIKLAVLSNKIHERTVDICTKLLPSIYFDRIYGARIGIPLKPDPYMALQICSELDVKPCECAYIGDSNVDIFTAHNAKMTGIGCAWGYRGRDELENAGADFVIDYPQQLLEIIV